MELSVHDFLFERRRPALEVSVMMLQSLTIRLEFNCSWMCNFNHTHMRVGYNSTICMKWWIFNFVHICVYVCIYVCMYVCMYGAHRCYPRISLFLFPCSPTFLTLYLFVRPCAKGSRHYLFIANCAFSLDLN